MVDGRTAQEIDKAIKKILGEMGVKDPPLRIDDVIKHMAVDRAYYNLEDPGLHREFLHKLRIGGKKAKDILHRIKLSALWLPDQKRILIDNSIVENKMKWTNAHELSHGIIPAHQHFFCGDTAETLDPEYHEILEAEANYGASALIFMGDRFTAHGRDCSRTMGSILKLSSLYQNSQTTTIRRFVQHTHDCPMLAVVSTPSWQEKPEDQKSRCRYFIPSPRFQKKFSSVSEGAILEHIDAYSIPKKGGPVGSGTFQLCDDNGERHEFFGETFFNHYYLQSLIVHQRALTLARG